MIDPIGARLRQARELRHLSLREVSETTKVRPHYLQALESDDYSAIPSAAQARGFLRLYAEFLELDLAELLQAAPAPAAVSVADAVPSPLTGIPSQDAAASKAAHPSFWTNLRERFTRCSTKDATDASLSPIVSPEPSPASESAGSPQVAEPMPASTEATTKTSRRAKLGASDATDANAVDVKKNIGS